MKNGKVEKEASMYSFFTYLIQRHKFRHTSFLKKSNLKNSKLSSQPFKTSKNILKLGTYSSLSQEDLKNRQP